MKKRIISAFLILATMVALTVHAAATPAQVDVESRIPKVLSSLDFTGTTAQCKAIIRNESYDIVAHMELWTGSKLVRSWSASGTGYVAMDKTCTVTRGTTYTLKIYGTFDGKSFSLPSVSKQCP